MPFSRPSSPLLAAQAEAVTPPKASALSSLMTAALEGFAAYAEAMHPICFDLSEYPDHRGPLEDIHLREREDIARSPARQTAPPARSARITARVAELWSRMRRTRERNRTMMELDLLDERTLQDVGLYSRPIDAIRSNGDPCE